MQRLSVCLNTRNTIKVHHCLKGQIRFLQPFKAQQKRMNGFSKFKVTTYFIKDKKTNELIHRQPEKRNRRLNAGEKLLLTSGTSTTYGNSARIIRQKTFKSRLTSRIPFHIPSSVILQELYNLVCRQLKRPFQKKKKNNYE